MLPIKSKTHGLILCALFAALIAVGAFIKIPIPVCPFTLQTLFVAMAGVFLPPILAAASAGVYLVLGLAGLPVFTQGGGLGYVMMPTFGYIIGFVVGAYMISLIIQKSGKKGFAQLFTACCAGIAVIYLIGLVYFYCIANFGNTAGVRPIGVWALILNCCLIFLPGDLLSAVVASLAGKRLIPVMNRGVL